MRRDGAFSAALFEPDSPAPSALCDPSGAAAGVRFDVYRNNVSVSLIEALRATYPVIERLVGSAAFSALARAFARSHPPRSPLMVFYGAAFADWMAGFAPLARFPYLPEVARIEYARVLAYHAADARPLDAERLRGLNPDDLAELRVAPHPSARVVPTRYPALSIWAKNTGNEARADASAGEVLICRPVWSVQIVAAPEGTGAMLNALAKGRALGDALPARGDPAAILGCLFSMDALAETHPPEALT